MSKGFGVPDNESNALKEVLRQWKAAGKTWRDIGVELGYPIVSASQTITNAVNVKRPGREMAEKIYARLGTTREAFLAARGIVDATKTNIVPLRTIEPANAERVLRIAATLTPPATVVDVMRVVESLAAMKGSTTDQDIARFLREAPATDRIAPTIIGDDDDLGGGLSEGPKPTLRRKK